MTTAAYPHIEIGLHGEPVISGAGTPVILIAMDRLAHHWDADEIQRQHPHLSLGEIHSALAYYYDHETDLNRRIQDRLDRESQLLSKLGESRVRAKLNAAKGPA